MDAAAKLLPAKLLREISLLKLGSEKDVNGGGLIVLRILWLSPAATNMFRHTAVPELSCLKG
jgi:hypothetical protein